MAKTPESKPAPTPKPAKPDWKALHLWQIQGVRDVLVFLAVLGLLWVGQKTSVVTVPLLLALLLAYLFEPVIVWAMARCKVQRRTAVVSILAAVVLVVAVPAVVGGSVGVVQLAGFANRSVDAAATVREALVECAAAEAAGWVEPPEVPATPADESARTDPPEVQQVWRRYAAEHDGRGIGGTWFWVYDQIRASRVQDARVGNMLDAAVGWIDTNREAIAKTAASFGAETAGTILRLVGAAFGLTFTAFVTAFFFFFVSTEWVKLKRFGVTLLPDRNRDLVIHLLRRFDAVISGFIRGRLTIAFLQAIVFSVGYLLIGVPAAFLLGPLVALLSIVPYLALVGVPVSVLLLALSVDKDGESFRAAWWWILGAPTVFYFIGQALDDYVWTPMIQGKSTGMDTPTILFASLAGGALFGVFGLLIAIPIAACLKILIQEVFWPRFKAWAEGREKDFLPIGRD
jgi:predicted PurR-regulated permease PerM